MIRKEIVWRGGGEGRRGGMRNGGTRAEMGRG